LQGVLNRAIALQCHPQQQGMPTTRSHWHGAELFLPLAQGWHCALASSGCAISSFYPRPPTSPHTHSMAKSPCNPLKTAFTPDPPPGCIHPSRSPQSSPPECKAQGASGDVEGGEFSAWVSGHTHKLKLIEFHSEPDQ
jgi:hypothetical protein